MTMIASKGVLDDWSNNSEEERNCNSEKTPISLICLE